MMVFSSSVLLCRSKDPAVSRGPTVPAGAARSGCKGRTVRISSECREASCPPVSVLGGNHRRKTKKKKLGPFQATLHRSQGRFSSPESKRFVSANLKTTPSFVQFETFYQRPCDTWYGREPDFLPKTGDEPIPMGFEGIGLQDPNPRKVLGMNSSLVFREGCATDRAGPNEGLIWVFPPAPILVAEWEEEGGGGGGFVGHSGRRMLRHFQPNCLST